MSRAHRTPTEGIDYREVTRPRHLVAICAYCGEEVSEYVGTMDANRRGARRRRMRADVHTHVRCHHPERLTDPTEAAPHGLVLPPEPR